jgi:hypothetical protein
MLLPAPRLSLAAVLRLSLVVLEDAGGVNALLEVLKHLLGVPQLPGPVVESGQGVRHHDQQG